MGIPHIAVSIALRIKGRTEVGVVYDPIRDELFTSSRGNGAQLNGYRIRVGQSRDLDGCILATSFLHRHRHHLDAYKKMFNGIFDACVDIRRAGTASLDLVYVAAGRVDGYWELGLKPWDLAAGEPDRVKPVPSPPTLPVAITSTPAATSCAVTRAW